MVKYLSVMVLLLCCVAGDVYAAFLNDDVDYSLDISGVEDKEELKDIRSTLKENVLKIELKDDKQMQVYHLRKNAKENKVRLISVLKSLGYYVVKIDSTVKVDKKTPEILFTIKTGEPLAIAQIEVVVRATNPTQEIILPTMDDLEVKVA